MSYEVRFAVRALKELDKIPDKDRRRILDKIRLMQEGEPVPIRKLTNRRPAYRLRVGDYRVLFECEERVIVIHHVLNRRDAYKN